MTELEKSKLVEVKGKIFERQNEIEATLGVLRRKLPGLLLAHEMGEIDIEGVLTVKTEIARLEQDLEDVPLILEAVQMQLQSIKQVEAKVQRAIQLDRAWEQYQQLTSNLLEQPYNRWLDGKIRQVSHELGLTSETNELINEWRNKLSRTVVSEL